jgi:cell division protein FtsX
MMVKFVVENQLYYWQKTLLVAVLASLLIFIAVAAFIFTSKIKELANKPLESLETEIILQKDRTGKAPQSVRTKGNILPFNLDSFRREAVVNDLKAMDEVNAVSTALVFWEFSISNTITIIGIEVNDPPIGIRKISSMLMSGRFFESDTARDVILERHFSQLFGYKVGGIYPVEDKKYRIVGIVDFMEQSNLSNAQVFMPYETAIDAVGGEKGTVNQVYVSLKKATFLDKVKKELAGLFPDLSVITKDKLLANLSNLNRIFYKFGDLLVAGIFFIVLILVSWILVMYRLEFKNQIEVFRILGWRKRSSHKFVIIDLFTIMLYSGIIALALTLVFYLIVVPGIQLDSLLNQGFKL